MAGLNKCMLIGHVGKDPELTTTTGGSHVCKFSIATSERYKDKSTGEMVEKTEWHRIICWGALATNCSEYLSKGRQVYIEGKLQTRSWEQDGVKRYMTEVVAFTVQFLGRRDEGGGEVGSEQPARAARGGGGQQQGNGGSEEYGATGGASSGVSDDDLPF